MSTIAIVLGSVADLGLVGVIGYLIVQRKKLVIAVANGGTMQDRDEREEVPPGPEPPEKDQTHNGPHGRENDAE